MGVFPTAELPTRGHSPNYIIRQKSKIVKGEIVEPRGSYPHL